MITYKKHSSHTSKLECHDTYIGNSPWTEPETKAIRDFVLYGANSKFEVRTICDF